MTAATVLLPWMSHTRRLRVAVVGAGAAGLCAARHILSRQDTFAPPVVYEQTKQLGGTWVYEERVGSYDNGLPIHSSMYRNLRTNLPKEVMMFPDFPFDPQLPSFLPHQEVLRYLERYCQSHNITPHIRFETVVEEVKPISTETEAGKVTWEVTSSCGQRGQRTETFDGVFICNGHFSDPHWPSIPGLECFKGKLLHSHSYRHPEPFAGQSVVILGAGASGIDISIELASINAQVILSHSKPPLSFPLPRNQASPPSGPTELGLQVRDQLIYPLYKFLLPPTFPSLFIVGVCKVICPFPHFHCQVQFALAVLDGSLALPSHEEMEEEVKREMERKTGEGVEARHLLKMDSDQWAYYRTLASMGGFSPLPPVTQSLYEEVKRQRERHPLRYRQLNYQLVSDTQWEMLELHPESKREGGKGK
ncbi:hypothetical protein MATL_G00045540 [Megalops atlanticus]|uniref:Flavin-containing monooxygenase n=1 Tax=Megalops atlanticus TaxID=7932 RepID=A0A9D3TIL3_MEGAT|nr:hypothetical protein MATL_G00045540 [Megalops atlanticus]